MSTLNQELSAIKSVEDTLTANKVANFAYTQEAYDNNDADGVEEYDFDQEQNIPVADLDILRVNETVLTKGWRSQASAITRMLMNHFLGRLSYNLNKLNDNVSNLLATLISKAGTADGFATLDSNGRIPYSQLPESAIEYKGQWNASTNTPTLADGTGTKGDFYIVSVAGTQDLGSGNIQFFVNDRVIYDGSVWSRLSAGDVKSVNNITPVNGNITLTKADVGLGDVVNTGDEDIPTAGSTKKFTSAGAYNTLTSLAPAFDETVTYNVEDLVTYQGKLYTCTVSHTGAWDDTHFTLTSLSRYIGTVSNPVKDEIKAFSAGGAWNWVTALVGRFLGGAWARGTGINANASTSFLVYANGLWVCVVDPYQLWWSEDGKTWAQGTGDTTYAIQDLTYANGLWICGAYRAGLRWSEDGKTWTQCEGFSNSTSGYFPTYANGLWVCGSSNAGMWWSVDGKAWTQGTGYNTSYAMLSLVYANGLWLLCTRSHGIWWSEDGKTWTQGTGANTTYTMQYVVYANGLWVCGSDHGIWWSEDGKAWTQGTGDNTTYNMHYLVYADGLWVCGSSHGIWWSEDGKAWTQGTGDNTTYTMQYLVYANGLWVCGSANAGMWCSVNGKAWTQGTGANTTYRMQYLVYANGLWVCGSYNNGMWCSEDGHNWIQGAGANATERMQYLVYANGLWVCGSMRGIWHGRDLNDLIADGTLLVA